MQVDNSKMTLKPWKEPSITIVLLGESGVGKTTFLDLLSNVCAGRPLEEFQPIHEPANENDPSLAGTQTEKPMLYKLGCANGFVVRVLDTPGFTDSRGPAFDDKHKAAIVDAVLHELDTITSVIVLANGTMLRLSAGTRHALSIVSSILPRSLLDNVGFMFTGVSHPLLFNFKREALHPVFRQSTVWAIENPLRHWYKYQQDRKEFHDDEDLMNEMHETANLAYVKTLRTLEIFFQWHDKRIVHPKQKSTFADLRQVFTRFESLMTTAIAQKQVQSRSNEPSSAVEIELSQTLSEYNNLISSGSYADYLSSALELLQLREMKSREKGAGSDLVDQMKEDVRLLKMKQEVVGRASGLK